MYFHANLDLHSNINNIKNEVRVFQSCTHDYVKLIGNSKDPDHTCNSLSTEYHHLSQCQLKMILKELKNDTNNEDSTRICYVSKLIRIKCSKKSTKLRTEMAHDEKNREGFLEVLQRNFRKSGKGFTQF